MKKDEHGKVREKSQRGSSMNQYYKEPILALHQEDLRAIDYAVIGVLPLLKRRRPIPSDTIQKFQSLRLKLAPLLREGGFPEGNALSLSPEELWVIDEALKIFIASIRQYIVFSTERESTLQALEVLHRSIRAHRSNGPI